MTNNRSLTHQPLALRKQQGVGLIEIMITVTVLMTGLTALMKLQTHMLKNGLYSEQRAEAFALAQRKLEDLHSFTTIAVPSDAPNWATDLTTEMAYNYIDTNKGGKIASGVVDDAPGKSAVYTLHWYVVDHLTGLALTPDTVNTSTSRRVSVVVSWVTANDEKEAVSVTDVLVAINPESSISGLKKSSTDNMSPHPATPLSELPAIAGVKTTRPIVKDTITKRETSWQESKEEGSHHQLSTVGCSCTQSATTDKARTASFRDGAGFDLGEWVVKRVGTNNGSDANCNVCCKNHHDTVYASAYPSTRYSYSAFRIQAGYRGTATNKDHSHYNQTGVYSNATHSIAYTPLITYTLADAAGKLYYEACFLEWVGGFATVHEDLTQIDLTVFSEDYINSAANQTRYSHYVKTLLEQTILAIDSNAINASTRLYAPPDMSNNAIIKNARSDLNIPSEVLTASSVSLKARAVALPYMKPWMIAILRCKINGTTLTYSNGSAITDDAGVAINCTNFPLDNHWLRFVPFHEVDVTDYVEWLVSNADNVSGADVVSAGVDERGNSMGLVTLGSALSASANVTARMKKSHSAYLGPDFFVNAYDDLDRLLAHNTITVTKHVDTPVP